HLEHTLREDQAALLRARLEDLEDQLLLAHAGRAGDVESLGDLGQRADAHVLERGELEFFRCRRCGGLAVAVPVRLRRRLAAGGLSGGGRYGLLLLVASRSISFHRSSNPSPVCAETAVAGV